jgi:hypothetical protein
MGLLSRRTATIESIEFKKRVSKDYDGSYIRRWYCNLTLDFLEKK